MDDIMDIVRSYYQPKPRPCADIMNASLVEYYVFLYSCDRPYQWTPTFIEWALS